LITKIFQVIFSSTGVEVEVRVGIGVKVRVGIEVGVGVVVGANNIVCWRYDRYYVVFVTFIYIYTASPPSFL
jgi:hypothetical protein